MIRQLVAIDAPILRQRALEVTALSKAHLLALAADLVDTLRSSGCDCLAAPQIGVPLRMIVLEAGQSTLSCVARRVEVLVNPIIISSSGSMEGPEACISLADHIGRVSRASEIRFIAQNIGGVKVDNIVKGDRARLMQHAIDHLDGLMFIDRTSIFYQGLPVEDECLLRG
ncbi:peptide deformylase [Burkholderia gladioli]|uniref:peptide deformylase n=1 Tax=Burkholderia gladioli TaxID=28095 RepID=UPI003F79A9AE